MKKFILPVFAIIALAACNSAAEKPAQNQDSLALVEKQNALTDSANFTTIEWVDSTYKDVGKVKKGQTVEIPFVVKNTGDKPLIIASVQPGCGCTVAEKPEKPIMPGEEEKIVAKFNSANQTSGSHSKNITVRANSKPNVDNLLTFKVEVVE